MPSRHLARIVVLATLCASAAPQFVPGPPMRAAPAMAYDASRKVGVLFGGTVFERDWTLSDATWTWNGSAWSKVEGTGPPPMSHCFMAPDPKGNGVLLFGGRGANGASDQTWAFTAAGWAELQPTHRPSPRSSVSGAIHAASGRLVIFGGSETSGRALADTWIWAGTDWQQIEIAKGPPARISGAACYDPIRKQVVLFGGWTKAGSLTDTWLWNGETWAAADAAYHPPIMGSSTMVFDAASETAILVGRPGDGQYMQWSWNGEKWNRLPRSLGPSTYTHFAMTEMGPDQPAVLFAAGDEPNGDTWTLREAEWTPMLVDKPKLSGQTLCLLSQRGRSRDDQSIQHGLDWLCAHQDGDGRWDCDRFMKHDREGEPTDGPGREHYDVGVTGLALLALLADTTTIKGYSREEAIRRGLDWLMGQQQENGLVGTTTWSLFIYGHAVATWVLSEACLMTPDPAVRRAAQRAADYLEYHRNPYGAWRYQPRDNDNDTSVTGWCAMALAMADLAGLKTNPAARQMAKTWFDNTCDRTSGSQGYQRAGEGSARLPGGHADRFPPAKTEALTALALSCRLFLGEELIGNTPLKQSADTVLAKGPVWEPRAGSIDIYYWYWASMAMCQLGGRYEQTWQRTLSQALRASQRTDGGFHGSWDPLCAWGEEGGRVYMTAMAVLSLQAPNRYVPWSKVAPLPDAPHFAAANRAFRDRRFQLFQSLLDRARAADSNQPTMQNDIAAAQVSLSMEQDRAMSIVESIRAAGDFEGGPDRLRVLIDEFGSLAPGAAATNLLAEWKADPNTRRELDAMDQYKRLAQKLRETTNPNTEASLRRELERCAKRYAGTKAAKLMDSLLGVKR